MKLKDPLFYAKILLFGEYSIIEDSMGLSIPFDFYKGKLNKGSIDDVTKEESNKALRKYFQFLSEQQEKNALSCTFDLENFEKDINEGLVFDSNIPQGFGVGSSGALVAAIYDKYSINPISSGEKLKKSQITDLKALFSQLESYFHGKSSGIDPLICYLNIPLLIKSKSDIGTVGIPDQDQGKRSYFLTRFWNSW